MIAIIGAIYFAIGCFMGAAIYYGSEGEPTIERTSMICLGLFAWPLLIIFVIWGIIQMYNEG